MSPPVPTAASHASTSRPTSASCARSVAEILGGRPGRRPRRELAGEVGLRAEEVGEVAEVHRRDDVPAPGQRPDHVVRAQRLQRLADRGLAHPELLAEPVHPQERPRCELPGEDPVAQQQGDAVGQRRGLPEGPRTTSRPRRCHHPGTVSYRI